MEIILLTLFYNTLNDNTMNLSKKLLNYYYNMIRYYDYSCQKCFSYMENLLILLLFYLINYTYINNYLHFLHFNK